MFSDENKCAAALKRIAQGDMSGLAVIYELLGRQIYNVALAVMNDSAEAEDVMQETFLKIAHHSDSFREGGSSRAWIMAIARNTAIDTLRKKSAVLPTEDKIMETAAASGDFTEVFAVNDLLKQLNETDRDIVILKVVDGFRFKEISEITGLSVANAQKRYRRALQTLKTLCK